eukprot:GHRR01002754.1.p1 GENE.GHRR01002754.1~~GHRR01002754.1.p1  ORF type:complete len:418 (+),score=218.77 GHRR01002754.1:189-1442(+)
MKSKGNKQGSSSPYLLDRNLTPRIEQYALNHNITDIDDVVDYLRRSHKEYQRKQVAALRQMVLRAVQVLQQKGVTKPQLQLQGRESLHLAARHGDQAATSINTGAVAAAGSQQHTNDANKDVNTYSGSSRDLTPAAAADMAEGVDTTPAAMHTRCSSGLNGSLLNMYSASKPVGEVVGADAAAAANGHGQSQQSDSSSSDGAGSENNSEREVDPSKPPAFAPQKVIAAAAARALAAEKAANAAAQDGGRQRARQQTQQPAPGAAQQATSMPSQQAVQTVGSPAATTGGGENGGVVAAAAASIQQPIAAGTDGDAVDAAAKQRDASAKQKKSRSAEEAGISSDSRALGKRARRVSAAVPAAADGMAAGGSRTSTSAVTGGYAQQHGQSAIGQSIQYGRLPVRMTCCSGSSMEWHFAVS